MKWSIALLALLLIVACRNNTRSPETPAPERPDTTIVETPEEPAPEPEPQLPDWPLEERTERGKLYPFDEAPKNPDFEAFRLKLYRAVLDKDVDFIKGIVDEDIKISYGIENGYADFFTMWKLNEQPDSSMFWYEMQRVLELGGGFQGDKMTTFIAPYLHLTTAVDDPYATGAIIGEGVRLRAEPSMQAEVLASLSFDKIEYLPQKNPVRATIDGTTDIWEKVQLADGTEGYVFGKFVRSPIDFRAGFEKTDEDWTLTFFVAGD